jgi:hypothetical protein
MALTGPIPELVENNLKHETICLGTHLLATALVVKVNIPYAHKVIKVRSHLNVVLATADTVATLKNNAGTAFTGGVLTITSTGSVADRDTSTAITAGTQEQAKDKDVQLSIDGGSTAGEATFWLEIERDDS